MEGLEKNLVLSVAVLLVRTTPATWQAPSSPPSLTSPVPTRSLAAPSWEPWMASRLTPASSVWFSAMFVGEKTAWGRISTSITTWSAFSRILETTSASQPRVASFWFKETLPKMRSWWRLASERFWKMKMMQLSFFAVLLFYAAIVRTRHFLIETEG